MALVSNPRHSLSQRRPVVPALGRVKSLVRTSSVMGRLRRRKSSGALSLNGTPEHAIEALCIETFVSTAIGSSLLDDPITHLICANQSSRPLLMGRCSEQGIVSCPRCQLVKYCSERCQKQHWTRHRTACAHPYLEDTWQPGWVLQDRPPSFACASTSFSPSLFISPVFDVLREQALDCDFKLCFPACIDIRNLIETVNNLPLGYRGRFDVLLNTSDPITANRNLVILYALLHPLDPEPSTDKVAALAVHLMYSSALTSPGAAYLKRCLDDIYGSQYEGDNFSFRISLGIRGKGKIHSLQTITGTKQPREMFNSTYGLAQALRSQRRVLDAPENTDHWDRFLSRLKPSHRMAFKRFRDTGVLAPFSADTSHFTHPNRLMFSAKGEWLGRADFNPFQGWDATAVQESGHRIASINSADIFSCLFFHLKSEFQRFISQVENLNLNFVLTQYDPHILAKGISAGIVPIFEGACFDRIDTRDMMDDIGINSCLADWGPLLNRENPSASLLMCSRAWHYQRPYALARCNPRAALELFMHKCSVQIPTLNIKLKNVFAQGLRSPALLKLVESLDAFYDHDEVFQEFLEDERVAEGAARLGLCRRIKNRIHSKRFGVPLHATDHQLPDISRNEFYDLSSLCEVDFSARFLEFSWIAEDTLW